MHEHAHCAALAALRFWATAANGDEGATAVPDAVGDVVHRAARLVFGDDALPRLDLTRPLTTVFGRLQGAPAAYVRRAPLALTEETLFPSVEPHVDAAATDRLRAALRSADDQSARLPIAPRVEALLFALQRYAWCLPSPLDGVSLYDAARIHAAVAAALAAALAVDADLLLVGGDISGVQEFIYSVSAAGATRQLRGRSFYLQLLTDACAHDLLHQAGMPFCNLLYAGGGRFYVLLPASYEPRLVAWRRDIGQLLLDAHGGALYLALGGVRFAPQEYNDSTWQRLTGQIDDAKLRRFAELDDAAFAGLFEPVQPEPPPDSETQSAEPLDAMGESLEDLGRRLARVKLLSVEPREPRAAPFRRREARWHEVLRSLGLNVAPLDDPRDYRADPSHRRRVLLIDDSIDPQTLPLGPQDVVGMRYTVAVAQLATLEDVAQYQALERNADDDQTLHPGDVKPFNLLAEQSLGVRRIGVLRMDVDDLGDLFGRRLNRPPGLAGLAVTAALSATLSRYFEGWVGELCRRANNDDGAGGVYAVYSGGDDLFLVGSWHRMPRLAQQIRRDFARYALGRAPRPGEAPPITLSGGMTLHTARYPLYQAADDAAEALDAAKRHTRPDRHAKDAMTFLGRTLGWEHFGEAADLCDELVDLVQKQGVPRSLLMVIQTLDARARQAQRRNRGGDPQFTYGPWVWQGAYQLTRVAERSPNGVKERIADLRERIVGDDGVQHRFIERAGLAARWAQLLVRERSSAKEER
ncbi:MAG: type III-A CRISPR-associated protein Cas10/Csm1 [Roseiflexaceae bacterium]|nr:type III-A CRISPR-associated protein Cas10/Csm1 [Roseiflexaceae bacterium]